ncbi:hypothetical protein [Kalamiella sp. sgz302252]|uniref:hypothetical protein n=1 Tax=Pantoea sp. sgz302252 TaxID=3341827 RepID=UPI0036D4345D
MNFIGKVANGYISVSLKAEDAKNAVKTRLDKLGETKTGQKLRSFAGYVKKVANSPVNLVKKHPKAVIATGLVTTVLAGITANVPLAAVGVGLTASGMWARSSNHNSQVKSELAEVKENLNAIKNNIAQTEQPRLDELQTR